MSSAQQTTEQGGGRWRIITGRWQDVIGDQALYDVVISDPPYDDRTHAGGRRGAGADDAGICADAPIPFDPIDPADIALPLVNLARRWCVLFCSVEQLGEYRAAAPAEYVRGGAWCKANPPPQFSGDRPAQWGDGIAILHRPGRKRWARGGHAAVWHHPTTQATREPRVHPAQKPLGLMLDLVADFSEVGETIVDPYCGSGTTGAAAVQLGRKFVGVEENPEHAAVAAERLYAAERGLSLRAARVGLGSKSETINRLLRSR